MSVFSDTLTRYIEHKNIKVFSLQNIVIWIVLPCTKSSMENGTRHLLKFLKR